jgi:protein SCO1/2
MDTIAPEIARKSKLWIIVLLGICTLAMAGVWAVVQGMKSYQTRTGADKLADYGTVPNEQLVERSGRKVALGELKGKVWVADFIFTRCGGSCPAMTAKMSELQGSLSKAGDVRLVSFTVDPDHDNAAKLKSYADGFQAQEGKWLFLTGGKAQMQNLAKNSFHLAIEDGTDPNEPIIHSMRFILVDAEGHIRGYYSNDDREAKQKMLTDIGILLREKES